jgi:hypothetical protein
MSRRIYSIERDAEEERPEEPGGKADAGIHPYCCASVLRDGDAEHTRSQIGVVPPHDEAGDQGQP